MAKVSSESAKAANYVVTITKLEVQETTEQVWQKVAETGNARDNGPVLEYVPRKTTTVVEIEVLRQQIATLDVAAVIKAVNQL